MTEKRRLKKRPHKPFHKGRNAIDETLLKVRGCLTLLMSMSNDGRCESCDGVAGVIWLIDDELERLDDQLAELLSN